METIERLKNLSEDQKITYGALRNKGMSIDDALASLNNNKEDNLIFGDGGVINNFTDSIDKNIDVAKNVFYTDKENPTMLEQFNAYGVGTITGAIGGAISSGLELADDLTGEIVSNEVLKPILNTETAQDTIEFVSDINEQSGGAFGLASDALVGNVGAKLGKISKISKPRVFETVGDALKSKTADTASNIKDFSKNAFDKTSEFTKDVKNSNIVKKTKDYYNEKFNDFNLGETGREIVKNIDDATAKKYMDLASDTSIKAKPLHTQVIDDVADDLLKIDLLKQKTGSAIGDIYKKLDDVEFDRAVIKENIDNALKKYLDDRNLIYKDEKLEFKKDATNKTDISAEDVKEFNYVVENANNLLKNPTGKNLTEFLKNQRSNVNYEKPFSADLNKGIASTLKDLRNTKLTKSELKEFDNYSKFITEMQDLGLIQKSGKNKGKLFDKQALSKKISSIVNQAGRKDISRLEPLEEFVKRYTGNSITDRANFSNILGKIAGRPQDSSGFVQGIKEATTGAKDIPLSKAGVMSKALDYTVGLADKGIKKTLDIKDGLPRFKELVEEIKNDNVIKDVIKDGSYFKKVKDNLDVLGKSTYLLNKTKTLLIDIGNDVLKVKEYLDNASKNTIKKIKYAGMSKETFLDTYIIINSLINIQDERDNTTDE